MPFGLTVAAATHGMAFGLWPISWIVVRSVLFYNLSVESGDFDVIRRSLARLTTDRRIQVLLVAFCFGALIEGIAGFGAPVAITASMLAGLGFEPIMAAVLALIANTAPVAFGSLGIPVTTLGGLLAPMLGEDVQTTTRALSAMVGRQLPFFSLIIPAYLVVLYAGWGRMMAVFPAVFTAGVSFAIGQFVVSNYVGPELTDTLAALFSLASVALLLKFWSPKDAYVDGRPVVTETIVDRSGRVWRAYATYGILIVTVLIGQVGNFAGMSQLQPPANVTMFLRCGQIGNRLCPEPWIGQHGGGRSARLPLPGVGVQLAGRLQHGRRQADRPRAARSPGRRDDLAVSADLPARFPGDGRHAGAVCDVHRLRPDGRRGCEARYSRRRVPKDRRAAAPADRDDRVHPLDRDGDELLRHDLVDGARTGGNRLAVPVLLRVARHAWRVPDRQRHVIEHVVRAAAGDDRARCRDSIRS